MTKEDELTAGLRAELARVNARLADQPAMRSATRDEKVARPGVYEVPVKTYCGGKPWPVAPSNLNPEHIIRQLVTALEGSGTRLRTDQWYVEIEAVAAGKRYLAEMAMLGREKMDEEHRAGFDGPPED
jgi:hypothetical protein